jgi:uncharacterized protein YcfJ
MKGVRRSLKAMVISLCWGVSPWAAGEHGGGHREYAPVVGVEPIVETVYEPAVRESCGGEDRPASKPMPLASTIGEDVRRQIRLWRRQQVCRERELRPARQRITGYWVTYRFGGRTATTRLSYDPGDRIPVDVSLSPLP